MALSWRSVAGVSTPRSGGRYGWHVYWIARRIGVWVRIEVVGREAIEEAVGLLQLGGERGDEEHEIVTGEIGGLEMGGIGAAGGDLETLALAVAVEPVGHCGFPFWGCVRAVGSKSGASLNNSPLTAIQFICFC